MDLGDILLSCAIGGVVMICIVAGMPDKVTDADILKSRNYLADFDRRFEAVNESMELCKSYTDLNRFNSCKASAYDSVGFKYDSHINLSDSYKAKVERTRVRAMMPLSTEITFKQGE